MPACRNRSRIHAQVLALAVVALAALAMVVPARGAFAGPVGVTAFGGFYSGGVVEDGFIGAGVKLGLGSIGVTPNAEYIFVSNGTAYTLNADFTMPILPLGVASLYAGAGAGMIHLDPDNGESNTNSVVNLLVGAGFAAMPMKPYAQAKLMITDGDDPMALMVGVRF